MGSQGEGEKLPEEIVEEPKVHKRNNMGSDIKDSQGEGKRRKGGISFEWRYLILDYHFISRKHKFDIHC